MVEIEWQTARLGILAVFSALRGQLITWSKVCGSVYLPNTVRLFDSFSYKIYSNVYFSLMR